MRDARGERRGGSAPWAPLGLMVASLVATSSASALDFKGLALGEPTTTTQVETQLNAPCKGLVGAECDDIEWRVYATTRVSCAHQEGEIAICNGMTTVAGFSARANVVINERGLLRRVWLSEIDPDNFDAVLAELTKKFGRPKSVSKPPLQNAFGAKYQQSEATWQDAQQRQLTVWKYLGSTRESVIYFSTDEDRRLMKQASEGKHGDL